MRKSFLPVVVAGLWITLSEFVRNEFFLKHEWVGHYAARGLRFETLPLNGILWTVWSLLLAGVLERLLRKLAFGEAVAVAWVAGFPLMWITLYNLQVLPLGILAYAVPLSLLEVGIAGLIIQKLRPR